MKKRHLLTWFEILTVAMAGSSLERHSRCQDGWDYLWIATSLIVIVGNFVFPLITTCDKYGITPNGDKIARNLVE